MISPSFRLLRLQWLVLGWVQVPELTYAASRKYPPCCPSSQKVYGISQPASYNHNRNF